MPQLAFGGSRFVRGAAGVLRRGGARGREWAFTGLARARAAQGAPDTAAAATAAATKRRDAGRSQLAPFNAKAWR